MNYISFDSQLNVKFNAVKIKNIPLNRKLILLKNITAFRYFCPSFCHIFDEHIVI